MRRPFIVPALIFAAVTGLALAPGLGHAQGELPQPPVGFKPPPPPPPAPIKPYTQVTVTPAGPFSDPTFAAFRQNLADIAKRKDRAALAKLVAARDFFWMQDKDLADKNKSGIDNLAKAIDLDNPNGDGWEIVADAAADPTLAEVAQSQGLFCAPAPPTFDARAFQALFEQTNTDPDEWVYPTADGTEVRAAAQPNAPVIDKLGRYFVRVLPDSAPANDNGPSFLHVALPNGKAGFVALDAVKPLGGDQICYAKAAGDWKIVGYVGGASP